DVAARGQLLVARFPVYIHCLPNEAHGSFFIRNRIHAHLLRHSIAEALWRGWRPTEKGLPPFQLGSADGWFGCPEDRSSLRYIDGLWSVLSAICRDPAWRERLARNASEFVPVPPEYVRGLDL